MKVKAESDTVIAFCFCGVIRFDYLLILIRLRFSFQSASGVSAV
jgi:hypothetical protein